ncbi:MAG: YceI family protein [Winogradskyella sp.]|uniref:YceI family protein n=1 Tax=Winogradskyella sp. TaxID=1883156 RepID=UPI000F400B37|nr:YceI family protein [Winogradskyella sp.]RNC84156.1 MAG: YceI family protein [Winogradskyella sp.]
MKTLKQITTLIIVLCIANGFSQSKTINTKKSSINWTGKAAFNAYSLTGTLNVKNGSITIDNDSITSLNIIIDMKSLDHENGDLKKHLRSKDFFEVNTYKEASYSISEPVQINNGKAIITGKMKIKDIEKDETFIVALNNDYSELTFNISMDRTLYGVKFNSPSFFKKMKENAIADEFKLKGSLVLE